MFFLIPLEIPWLQLPLFRFFAEENGKQNVGLLHFIRSQWWAGQQISKYQVLFIFYVETIEKTGSFRNDDLRWLFQKQTFAEVQQNIAILKNFVKFTKKTLCRSPFLKQLATLKDSGTSVFL